ncbi:MAG TPA: hypothetical protein VFS47_03490 [Steroidobacteraceae bacterium]|nr:hypothetical protein [Steroidobacteraceae bacterium]
MNSHPTSSVVTAAIKVVLVGTCIVGASIAQAAHPLVGAINEIKPIFDSRLRYETVDQEALAEDADVETLRLRAGFETGKAWETSLLAEGEFVWAVNGDYRPDNAVSKDVAYPIVADREAREVNRLQLTNTAIPLTTITLGRQRILLDDQRFVGNVGWRQNEQTFDGLRVVNKTVKNFIVDVAYVDQVNRIYGPDSPQGRYKGDVYLSNLTYQMPVGKLTAFNYVLKFDPLTQAEFPDLTAAQAAPLNPTRASTSTYGLRFAGERRLSEFKVGYAASLARQKDAGQNPFDFTLDYRFAELTGSYRQFTLGAGYEWLESNGTVGFSTPLGTLHKFQGWADKFLATPANGIDDRYMSAGVNFKGVGVLETLAAVASYHVYEAQRISQDYGDEIDVQLQGKWQRVNMLLKYAGYKADALMTDTTKWWAQVEYVW